VTWTPTRLLARAALLACCTLSAALEGDRGWAVLLGCATIATGSLAVIQ
jgi:hypothetical protein